MTAATNIREYPITPQSAARVVTNIGQGNKKADAVAHITTTATRLEFNYKITLL